MACEVCEHCHSTLSPHDDIAVRDGYSYHEKCHKCYVCSETNLQDAEVFKGVIFCSSCSQRIFQGCSTARRNKNSVRRTRSKSHRRRSHRTQDRRTKRKAQDGILELAGLNAYTDSSNSCCDDVSITKESKSLSVSTEPNLQVEKKKNDGKMSMKRSSVEMGTTTEVTQELLKQMNCPVVHKKPLHPDKSITKERRKMSKSPCSDLRMAELGASTEIANMALRYKSELPVIIKSDSPVKPMTSSSGTLLNQESDTLADRNDDWLDSAYSSLQESTRKHWMDRRLRSILKFPYIAFKRNILDQSSLIGNLTCSHDKVSILKTIKLLFREDITEHQKRGLKRLYSTINRKTAPQRLGWLQLVNTTYDTNLNRSSRYCKYCNRCKHFKTSHSYRCMRNQVMRLAGPTKSELATFRNKIKNTISPGFLRSIAPFNRRLNPAQMMSQACGNSEEGSNTLK